MKIEYKKRLSNGEVTDINPINYILQLYNMRYLRCLYVYIHTVYTFIRKLQGVDRSIFRLLAYLLTFLFVFEENEHFVVNYASLDFSQAENVLVTFRITSWHSLHFPIIRIIISLVVLSRRCLVRFYGCPRWDMYHTRWKNKPDVNNCVFIYSIFKIQIRIYQGIWINSLWAKISTLEQRIVIRIHIYKIYNSSIYTRYIFFQYIGRKEKMCFQNYTLKKVKIY